jgi:hypothetical protein
VSASSVSVSPARSNSRYQSVFERASRDTSNTNTIPTWPSPTRLVNSVNPERTVSREPDTPRSASITRTDPRGQPKLTARSTSAYCRSVDSRLRSSWLALDWRT